MRIQKVLRDAGIGSRRKVEDLIERGEVLVNGRLATLGMDISGKEDIRVFGKKVKLQGESPAQQYIAFHKPQGVVSTKAEGYDERTVYDLLPPRYRKLNIVGRLDKESSGLMLLLSNGALVHVLTHPKFQVEKEYIVQVNRNVDTADLTKMKRGVTFEGIEYRAKQARILRDRELRIILTEGKKREIRYMLRALKYDVESLVRVRIGPIELGKLRPGQFRPLDENEARVLNRMLAK